MIYSVGGETMKPKRAIKEIEKAMLIGNSVPVAEIEKYIRVLMSDNKMLEKDNKRLREKLKKRRDAVK